MKRVFSVVILLLVCLTIMIPANAATFPLNVQTLTLFKGDTATLTIEGVNSNRVTWKTSNKAVVSVNKKGEIRARNAGKAVITGKYSGIIFKCKVTVQNIKKLNTIIYSGKYGKLWLKEINSNGFVFKYKNTTKMDIWLDSEYFILDGKQLDEENEPLPGTDYWVVFNELNVQVPTGFTRETTMYLKKPSVKSKKLSGYISVMEISSDGGGYSIDRILLKNVKLQ